MAACARGEIVRPGEVGVYHCWGRCVRRAFLCGQDPLTGNNYQHRRRWLQDVQRHLAGLFAIDVGFHVEMSNHFHLVLRTRPDVVEAWTDEEVVTRWLRIAKLKRAAQDTRWDPAHWQPSEKETQVQLADPERVLQLRGRLSSVSWFIGALCENIGRRANREDGCRGRFWETRFSSRNLADEGAILVCGMYVDLNQIRAGEAATPETSQHTSAYDRIAGRKVRTAEGVGGDAMKRVSPDHWLCELTLQESVESDVGAGLRSQTPGRASDKGLLPISLDDYLQLLDWTGRQLRGDRRGSIPHHLAPILERLHVRADAWLETIEQFETCFGHVVGRAHQVTQAAARLGRRWLYGAAGAAQAFT